LIKRLKGAANGEPFPHKFSLCLENPGLVDRFQRR
jgi:hypothetical protein